jgi:hypothetical protein
MDPRTSRDAATELVSDEDVALLHTLASAYDPQDFNNEYGDNPERLGPSVRRRIGKIADILDAVSQHRAPEAEREDAAAALVDAFERAVRDVAAFDAPRNLDGMHWDVCEARYNDARAALRRAAPGAAQEGETGRDCIACGAGCVLATERRTVKWGTLRDGGRYAWVGEIDDAFWRCATCGEEFYDNEQSHRHSRAIYRALVEDRKRLIDAATPAPTGGARAAEGDTDALLEIVEGGLLPASDVRGSGARVALGLIHERLASAAARRAPTGERAGGADTGGVPNEDTALLDFIERCGGNCWHVGPHSMRITLSWDKREGLRERCARTWRRARRPRATLPRLRPRRGPARHGGARRCARGVAAGGRDRCVSTTSTAAEGGATTSHSAPPTTGAARRRQGGAGRSRPAMRCCCRTRATRSGSRRIASSRSGTRRIRATCGTPR